MNFFRINFQIFRIAFFPLLIVTILSNLIEQYTTQRIQEILSSHDGLRPILYVFIVLSILSALIFPSICFLISVSAIAYKKGKISLSSKGQIEVSWAEYLFSRFQSFEQVMIETIRSWGSILTWGLFLILPSLWRYLELLYVNFVVLLDSDYQKGEVDALAKSREIFRKRIFKNITLVFVFTVFIPLILTVLFESYSDFFSTPVSATLLAILEVYLLLVFTQLLFNTFTSLNTHNKETTL